MQYVDDFPKKNWIFFLKDEIRLDEIIDLTSNIATMVNRCGQTNCKPANTKLTSLR